MAIRAQAFWMLLPLVGAVRAAREARADLSQGILEVDSHRKQQMKLDSLQHVVDTAAAGELLVWRRLTGQPAQDLWTTGLEGYDVSRTLDAYQIDSTAKFREAVGAAVDFECFGAVLDPLHRCHKAFPIYDLMLTATMMLLCASGMCACCFCPKRTTASYVLDM
ncbi:unnamed protein product [Cladocopium goreaui]|uniref:Uncharacterized protein n=1 Tax=Cladocopium goreaui TaxID=2562237 RepID=A0A9P1GID7_9DINO|nr:unnamed protein product [Cladocopium goreaui]|mmetsp:Transcript_21876/g.45532  ORF Transcript_21876/g.45532 Transcript_21876/m.45532 type:complete len:164 (+) Transcript_21876:86-577(+)